MTQFYGAQVQMYGGGDPIAVLYDPSDPDHNTAIYEAKDSSLLGTGQPTPKRLDRAKLKQIGTDLPG